MDRLELLFGQQRELVVGVAHNDCPAGRVRQQVLLSGWFTSVHQRTETIEFWETQAETSRLARDNPFLDEADLRHLDEHGLIRPGAVVRDDMLLASILTVDNLAPKQRTAPGMQWVWNGSREAPPGWDGARVVSVERHTRRELGRGAPHGLLERIEVALRAERPLEAGDVLSLENTLIVVSGFDDDNLMPRDADGLAADVVVSETQAVSLGISARRFRRLAVSKQGDRAADVLRCRNLGPYSMISQRPLPKPPYGGLAVNTKQVAWLESRGLSALAAELVVLKSDDLGNRRQLAALATAPPGALLPSHVPGTPESLLLLRAWLMALGLEAAFRDEGSHVSRPCGRPLPWRSGGWRPGMSGVPRRVTTGRTPTKSRGYSARTPLDLPANRGVAVSHTSIWPCRSFLGCGASEVPPCSSSCWACRLPISNRS